MPTTVLEKPFTVAKSRTMPGRRVRNRRAGSTAPLPTRLLPEGGSIGSSRNFAGRSGSGRAVVLGSPCGRDAGGDVIFSMVCSFNLEKEGPSFDGAPRRTTPPPDMAAPGGWNTLLEVREVTPTNFEQGVFTDCVWVRSRASLGDDPVLQRAGLTYLSDLGTGFGQQDRALLGHGGPSIDHSVWFHEPIRADEWVLLDLRPLKARAGRGTYQGSLRDEWGHLGATICQEQLMVPRK